MSPRFLYQDPTTYASGGGNYTIYEGGNFTTPCVTLPDCIYPSLPSPPLPIIPSDPDSINLNINHPNRLLPNFLIAAASLLAFSFFLLILFYFLLRLRRHRRRRLLHVIPPGPHLQNPNPIDPFEDSFDGNHHVWFIRTVGLDDAVIKAISSKVYKASDKSIGTGDCSVCLGEFRDGEVVKILPKCKHGFHVECVDTWLKAHVNCPLCRAAVLEEVDTKSDDSESVQIEILENNVNVNVMDQPSSSRRNGDEDESEVQPTRRSVSMDASALGMLMIRVDVEGEGKLENEKKDIELVNVDGSKNDVVEMKRSMSSRSGRLFFPRYARGRSASVLPL